MVFAGYTFSVLSPAFTIHWGFHLLSSHPHWRVKQKYTNGRRGRTFIAELNARYGTKNSSSSGIQAPKHQIHVEAETLTPKTKIPTPKPETPTPDLETPTPEPEAPTPESETPIIKPGTSTLEPETPTPEPEVVSSRA